MANPPPTFNSADITLPPDVLDELGGTGVAPAPSQRYSPMDLLGTGGTGEVWAVYDRDLARVVALKTLQRAYAGYPGLTARFLAEARLGARLQHPGVVPVHDIGQLGDRRWYFTMDVVSGGSLSGLIAEVHAVGPEVGTRAGWNLRRLIDIWARVCETVAHAHNLGVIHRDLKPENIAVGSHGRVLVLDWGLARERDQPDDPIDSDAGTEGAPALRTKPGQIAGTPSYMSPEQAAGTASHDPRVDVYALGAMLYEILAGRPPYVGPDAGTVLAAIRAGPPLALSELAASRPAALIALADRCLSRDPAGRPASAEDVAIAARAWLDGLRVRESALVLVEEARAKAGEAHQLRATSKSLYATGDAMLAGLPAWAPEEQKAPGWTKHDEARSLSDEAWKLDIGAEGLLLAALAQVPDLPEAHIALAARYRAEFAEAEARRDGPAAAAAELRLAAHVRALPPSHPVVALHLAWLRGDGHLHLETDPPGAEVWLERYTTHRRRLRPVTAGPLGLTPLSGVTLPKGSYRLRLRKPGYEELIYPVQLNRCERWETAPPGQRAAEPVRLLRAGALGPEDLAVPAGWFQFGGDPEAMGAVPARRLWVDSFAIRRFPVTNTEYLAFLNDLVATGRESDALAHAPKERGGTVGEDGAIIYGRLADGRFVVRPDADGDLWAPDWPVMMVDQHGATAFAAWLGAREGHPWRLPDEVEWEKAARGVDGRLLPWGDEFDAAWCNSRASQPRPLPTSIYSFPADESPYGVRGTAGNLTDWTSSADHPGGPPDQRGRVLPHAPGPDALVVIRGGAYDFEPRVLRTTYRYTVSPGLRSPVVGFRVARSL